jgi:hypothetical protein
MSYTKDLSADLSLTMICSVCTIHSILLILLEKTIKSSDRFKTSIGKVLHNCLPFGHFKLEVESKPQAFARLNFQLDCFSGHSQALELTHLQWRLAPSRLSGH